MKANIEASKIKAVINNAVESEMRKKRLTNELKKMEIVEERIRLYKYLDIADATPNPSHF